MSARPIRDDEQLLIRFGPLSRLASRLVNDEGNAIAWCARTSISSQIRPATAPKSASFES
jgi:hypothetical protein